jgi:ATPase family AAA domain-containing protein 3A/B
VRDTSRFTLLEAFKHPIKTIKKVRSTAEDSLQGVVLEPKLEERLREIALATKNTKVNYGLFRNVMFHGPPGNS